MDYEALLIRYEGCRDTPYIDSVGVQTIGIGHNLHKPLSQGAILRTTGTGLRRTLECGY